MRFLVNSLALSTTVAAVVSSNHLVVHEKRQSEPFGWIRQERADQSAILPIRIGLKQSNLDLLDSFLHEISDPDSPGFGKHWDARRVAETFSASDDTTNASIKWLTRGGIDASRIQVSGGRNWLQFNATVREAEKLFHTQYYKYYHEESHTVRTASDHYSLPREIQSHIDFIMPTVQLDAMRPVARSRKADVEPRKADAEQPSFTGLNGTSGCDQLFTIDCIRALYNVPVPKGPPNKNNVMGIAEWADYLWPPDLDIYFANFTDNPKIPQGIRPQFISIDGGKRGTYDRVEAGEIFESNPDFMIAYPIIYPQNTRLYQVGDGVNMDSSGTFNIFLDALDGSYCTYQGGNAPYLDPVYPDPNDGGFQGPLQCGGAPISNVISISYGQLEGALPRFYQERQCREWAKLALQGVTVVIGSGDNGVANEYNANFNEVCFDPQTGAPAVNGTRFAPSFPANCPYVTAVGGTSLKSSELKDGEAASTRFHSGGGFSDVFPRPSWQTLHVRDYLGKYAPKYSSEQFNSSGRAYPDVSAMSQKLVTVGDGKIRGLSGTSDSTPLFGALINLINEDRLNAGKKPVGFLNPIMYKNPGMFNDITEGSSPGCGTQGFPASKGWDPVTGLGSPNYPKMHEVLMALP